MRGGGIKKIETLLEKYQKNLRAPEGSVIAAFQSVVQDTLGIPLKKEHIRYTVSTKTVSVTVTGPEKSEILFHKEKLLKACTNLLGEKSAPRHIV